MQERVRLISRVVQPIILQKTLGIAVHAGGLVPRGPQPTASSGQTTRTRTRTTAVDALTILTDCPMRLRSTVVPRLPMLPHLQWV
jgi:hypothetical protein